MPKKTTIVLVCEICHTESKPEESSTPRGWVQITVGHPTEDFKDMDVCICPYCLKSIKSALPNK